MTESSSRCLPGVFRASEPIAALAQRSPSVYEEGASSRDKRSMESLRTGPDSHSLAHPVAYGRPLVEPGLDKGCRRVQGGFKEGRRRVAARREGMSGLLGEHKARRRVAFVQNFHGAAASAAAGTQGISVFMQATEMRKAEGLRIAPQDGMVHALPEGVGA